MKLYYAPGACSLSPHIVAREAGIALDLERVDLGTNPHRTETGADFTQINRKGSVPALRLDDGQLLTEGAAIVQYLADLAPESGLAPAAGTLERYRLQEWLTFHRHRAAQDVQPLAVPSRIRGAGGTGGAGEDRAALCLPRRASCRASLPARAELHRRRRLRLHDRRLGPGRCASTLHPSRTCNRYMDRIAARPKVREAMQLENARTDRLATAAN